MYGVTNQDVFRWPAIQDGLARQLLGHFITTIHMPGIPLILWGEEQAFYVLDSTASNYIYGRQPMTSATQWQSHGCYALGSTQYYQMPWTKVRDGCRDDSVSYDHRDPSHPVYNTLRHMHNLRETYPVLRDGMYLQQLSNQTKQIIYPGSSGVVTETGLWSVLRDQFSAIQNLTGPPLWLIYSNLNESKEYTFDCGNNDEGLNITALVSPFSAKTTVKNLFAPYDEHTLISGVRGLGLNGSESPQGCLPSLEMAAYGWKAFVPISDWIAPRPVITEFLPGHDARIRSTVDFNGDETLDIEIHFSQAMNCSDITQSIRFEGTTARGGLPTIDNTTVTCRDLTDEPESQYVGQIVSSWSWSATLLNVENGIHRLSVRNASSAQNTTTGSNDHFLFRIGAENNPVVFPRTANYSESLLIVAQDNTLLVNHSAAGADFWRYSTNFASSFSPWMPYEGGIVQIDRLPWSGTDKQAWHGEHVHVEYYNSLVGSSDHVQQGDSAGVTPRRFPHMWLNGPYNSYGYDAGLQNEFKQESAGTWSIHWMNEWSAAGTPAQINIWGINPDGKPDQTMILGDVDGDSVLDRLPPSSLSDLSINITKEPPIPYLGWDLHVYDGSLHFELVPSGNMWIQLTIFVLLWVVPVCMGALSVWLFIQSFYKVKFNKAGAAVRPSWGSRAATKVASTLGFEPVSEKSQFIQQTGTVIGSAPRRRILIATMEYNIDDWQVKVKIGGLGVMAELMGKNLAHQDLIWVVPSAGGIVYPVSIAAH